MIFPFMLLSAAPRAGSERAGPAGNLEIAVLAGGCFWCVEADMEKLEGVKKAVSGYTGGDKANPSYEEVSSGSTGHIEAVQVFFDPAKISYSQILSAFWRKIDPTDSGGQFADRGPQYSSAIFYRDEKQKILAERSKKELEKNGPFKKAIVTPILPLKNFYTAEEYHQDYYKKNRLRYFLYRRFSGREGFLNRVWQNFKSGGISSGEKTKAGCLPSFSETASPSQSPKTAKSSGAQGPARAGSYFKPPLNEIKKALSDRQFQVTQNGGTEPPFQNKYWDHKKPGIYADIVSGEPLFSSLDKYDSKTGWPSFTKPLVKENIVTKPDRKLLALRTEIRSKYGDSHLGHVFEDGPPPLGLRYCVNSAALRFIPKNKLKEEGYGAFLPLFNCAGEKHGILPS